MWLFTPRGFYSVVEKWADRETGMVTVRARCKEDIDKLGDLLPDAVVFSAEDQFTDYEWRLKVPKEDWALAVARMAMEIDYSNFKSEVDRVQGHERASVYGSLWGTLLRLERPGRFTAKGMGKQLWDDAPAHLVPKRSTSGKARRKPAQHTSQPRNKRTRRRGPNAKQTS